jgi:hypothetical protein
MLALLIDETLLKEPGTWLLMLLFGISEILLTKVVDLATHAFLALTRFQGRTRSAA